ncbi:MAG: ATP-binding protein, partial [Proteobacteria bacterium]|nr:ATP-binding protein [Pseudomonadota bacterium]
MGKTTWLETHFQKNTLWIDLLRPEVYDELLLDLRRFEQQVLAPENRDKWVIIDEVQRLPRILDVVQLLIQKHKRKFALTGSSARRLKQQGSNLMAGRALVYKMFPLSMIELGRAFDLNRALEFGGLPDSVFASSEEPKD